MVKRKIFADIEQSSITSYEMSFHVSNDLEGFISQNQEEETAEALFIVILVTVCKCQT